MIKFNIESTSKEDGKKHVYHIESEKKEIIQRVARHTGVKPAGVFQMLKDRFVATTSFFEYRRVD